MQQRPPLLPRSGALSARRLPTTAHGPMYAAVSALLMTILVLTLLAHPPAAQAAEDKPVLLPMPQSVAWQGPGVGLGGSVQIVTLGDQVGDDVVAKAEGLVTGSGGTVAASEAKPSARIVLGTADADLSA